MILSHYQISPEAFMETVKRFSMMKHPPSISLSISAASSEIKRLMEQKIKGLKVFSYPNIKNHWITYLFHSEEAEKKGRFKSIWGCWFCGDSDGFFGFFL